MSRKSNNRRLRSGAALLVALVLSIVLSSIIGASLLFASNHHNLAYGNVRSEAALLLAEAGINDELQYFAKNLGNPNPALMTSQPVIANGETEVYPGDGHVIWGRKGSVDGYPGSYFWVYCTGSDGNAWNGSYATLPITIHASAKVNGNWRRVRAQANTISIFSLHAIFALAAYTNSSNAIGLSSATVTVEGVGGTNGTISNSSSTLVVSNALNANTTVVTSGQFTVSNVAGGGLVYTQPTPVIYQPVASVLKTMKNRTGDSDAQVWTWLAANSSNATGAYTYRANATSKTINTANCVQYALGSNILTNTGTGGTPKGVWTNAGYRPNSYNGSTGLVVQAASNASPIAITTPGNHGYSTGESVFIKNATGNTAANGNWKITKTGPKTFTLNGSTGNGTYTANSGITFANIVQTVILGPGDYYFTDINLTKGIGTEIVIDPQALASGGTPGQVRLWIYDPGNGTQNDFCQLPIKSTLAAGATEPDPKLFRVYYAKDNKGFTLERPPGVTTVNDSNVVESLTGDFHVYGAMYVVTKRPGDTSALFGTELKFAGSTAGDGGRIVLNGSLLADKIAFQGLCAIIFRDPSSSLDPAGGVGIVGGYRDDYANY